MTALKRIEREPLWDLAHTQLRDALQATLKALIDDGGYGKVLSKWNVSAGALKTAQINGGT